MRLTPLIARPDKAEYKAAGLLFNLKVIEVINFHYLAQVQIFLFPLIKISLHFLFHLEHLILKYLNYKS